MNAIVQHRAGFLRTFAVTLAAGGLISFAARPERKVWPLSLLAVSLVAYLRSEAMVRNESVVRSGVTPQQGRLPPRAGPVRQPGTVDAEWRTVETESVS